MKAVLLPSWYSTPEHRESGVFFKDQAIALAKIGCNVTVVYIEMRSLRFFSIRKFLNENHFQIKVERCDGIVEYCLKGWSFRPQTRIGAFLTRFLMKRHLYNYIKCYGVPDIIHAHSCLYGGYIAAEIKKQLKIPYVITEHASSFVLDSIPGWNRKYIDVAIKNANQSFAVGLTLQNAINKFTGVNKTNLFPNFIDSSFFNIVKKTQLQKKNGLSIFSAGNLIPNKGFDILLLAFAEAFRGKQDVILNIAGSGYLDSSLMEMCVVLGIREQVSFVGQLSRTQLRDFMLECDIFVLASRYETFGVVFIEAMCCGKPVIATKCGGPEDFINEFCGILIDKENIPQLVAALKYMAANFKMYNSQSIIDFVKKHFDSAVLAEKLLTIYRSEIG